MRQIDMVTVKGSQQPMGLYTYDVSLERVPTPNQGTYAASALGHWDSLMSQSSGAVSLADMAQMQNAPELLDDDVVSYSMSAYNWEFSDHPDLACTWAVDEAFLDIFAQAGRPSHGLVDDIQMCFLPHVLESPSYCCCPLLADL